MGVDYSSTMGYGIALKEDEWFERLAVEFEHAHEDGGINEFLAREEFTHLGYDLCGDFMCGETYMFFYIESTYLHASDYRQGEILTELDSSPVIPDLALVQLSEAMTLLGVTAEHGPVKPGWKLFLNIS